MGLGGGVEAGKAFVKFLLEDSEFRKSLKGVGTQLKNVGKIGAAATAPLVAGFTAAIATFVSVGDALGDMATRTGVGAEALSELTYAAGQTGTNITAVEKAIRKMQVNVGNAAMGTGTFSDTLAALGLDLAHIQSLTPEAQFMEIARAVGAIEDPATRAALAQKAFGKGAAELLPLLAQGADGIDKLRQRAQELGVTMSTEDVAAAQALDDALQTAKAQVKSMAIQVGAAVAGPLTEWLKSNEDNLAAIINFIKENPGMVKAVAAITAAVAAASIATYALGTALTIVSLHPIVAALAIIGAAVVVVTTMFDNWADRILAVTGPLGLLVKLAERLTRLSGGIQIDGSVAIDSPHGVVGDHGRGDSAGGPVAELKKMQADAAALQAKIAAMPGVQNVTMDQAALSAIDKTLGRDLARTADYTQRTAVALEWMVQQMRGRGGGGFPVGSG